MLYDNLINLYIENFDSILDEKKKVKGTTVKSDPKTGISISDEEDYVYDKLKDMYGSKDIERQYKDKEKYPWSADFYIKSENMIIEYESHWTHGRKKYQPDNPKHQEELEWLKSKNNEFYDRAIDTWTRLDPEKEETALKNGYKYLRFYNIDEFNKWFEDPSLTYEEYMEPIALKYDDIKTNKYYHDKEEKDRWNDGRDKDSPMKGKDRLKVKDESLDFSRIVEALFDDLNNAPENEQIQKIIEQPVNIYYIDNPSEKVQLAAVNEYGGVLKFIMKLWQEGRLDHEPSDAVKRAAIINHPFAIVNLRPSMQTQELQNLAIEGHANAIYLIWRPTEETWKLVKKLYPQYFDMLYKNWSENAADRAAKKAAKLAAQSKQS